MSWVSCSLRELTQKLNLHVVPKRSSSNPAAHVSLKRIYFVDNKIKSADLYVVHR